MHRGVLPSLVSVLLSVWSAGVVRAQPAEDPVAQDEARLHFQTGASYYDSGNYEDALREFRRSYDLSHRAALFYNMSLCYQQMGDLANAVTYLRRYLHEVPEIGNRANLEIRLRNLEERAERTETASARGERPTPPPGGSQLNIGAIVGYSVAGVGVLMFAIFGGLTLAEDSALGGTCHPDCTAAEVSNLRTYAAVTDAGWVTALVGAVAGTVLLLVLDTGGGGERARLTPWIDETGAGGVLAGSF